MLSVQPLKSANGAASYYLGVTNYYANDSNSMRWLGDGAKALGIFGKSVEPAQMMALLKGQLPDGTQLGRIDKDGIHHRPGFDMTVTAPKSFAILLESSADPRLESVFNEAVDWFVEEMEKEFAQARQLVDGKIEYIDTKNLVIAAFRHPNSRANDPLTHTHLVVQNMTQCPDGKWRSLASDMDAQKGVLEQIMKHHIYGGLKFRNKLANLTKGIGYSIVSDGEGLWEIDGVPESLLTHFSKRREAIETLMDEKGWSGAKAASLAAQKTKLDKDILDFDQWKKDIISECHDKGFDPYKLVESSLKPQNRFQTLKEKIIERFYSRENIEIQQAREAVYVAIESVSQQHAVFEERELKKEALKFVIASNKIVDESALDKVIAENISSQNLYQAIHPYTQKPLLTTPWQLTLESEAIERIEQGKGAISAICSKQIVRDFIKEKEVGMSFTLSSSQKKAMTVFLTSRDRFIAIQGYAGTGKTTMLRLTRELAEREGYQIRGITAGASAANELRNKGGLNAATFARELGRLELGKQDLSKIIFVVDEASMLSNPQGHKIIKLAEKFNTQLKIIGDRAQLPSPSSGKIFSLTQDYGIKTVAMTDNLRQKDIELKESAVHASLGEIYDAVEKLTHVQEADTYQERISYLAEKWLSLSREERQNTLCFAPRHKNRGDITEIIRESLISEGILTGKEYKQQVLKERNLTSIKLRKAVFYTKNDVIRFNNPVERYNIKSGDYLHVQAITNTNKQKNTLCLKRDNGQIFTFKLSYLPEFKTENKDLERPVEVYRQEFLNLMTGDTVQWKRNNERKGIRNSELATIKEVTQDGFIIQGEDNQILQLEHGAKELCHLDHGYVLTTYATQGKDKKRGIGLIESVNRFAASIQNYYVETTRGIWEMIVVTDDKEHLVKAITTNDSDKYSSIEMVDSDVLKSHETRFKDNKHSMALQNVIAKKMEKEQDWQVLENTVEAYVGSKQRSQTCHAAKLAWSIVHDPRLYRLAKERLGFTFSTYRRDALRFETSRLFHKLPLNERLYFSIVRQYVALNQQIVKRSQHIKEHALENGIQNAISRRNRNHIQKLSAKRNSLAFQISRDLERCKPYLHHFSIGELNRIGLPQYEYGREMKKAGLRLESLGKHAARDVIRENVSQYIDAQGVQKEMLAAQIKREAKLSHPFVLTYARTLNQQPNELWKSIHNDARAHSDRLFRKGLNGEGRLAFDTIKAYKQIQTALRDSWSTSLNDMEKGFNPKSIALLAERNELAHKLVHNKSVPEVVAWFKLDSTKLLQQNEKHQYRENIKHFISTNSDFNARMVLINEIKNDIKSHYPFIKEAGLDTKIIAKYLRVSDRQEWLTGMSGSEKKDYQCFLNYKRAGLQAYRHWQEVHQNKALGKQQDMNLVAKAIDQFSKRDSLAHKLKDSPYLDSILVLEKGTREKIMEQAGTHQSKLQELKGINDVMQTLSTQYAGIINNASINEVTPWKKNWAILCQHVNQIQKTRGYQRVLQEYSLNVQSVQAINNELKNTYNIELNPPQKASSKLINPVLQKIEQTSRMVDAKMVNKSLMANPETTYKAIFGEPKSENSKELRYHGGLIVALKGKDRGLWYDFSEGEGGAPIQAIMARENLSFEEALKEATTLAGMYETDITSNIIKSSPKHHRELQKNNEAQKKNKVISANSIWYGAINAEGTLAERYLKQHRGIEETDKLDIRFWPVGAKWKNCNENGIIEDKVNKVPALIIAARNEKNDITAVQRIYLDNKTANKNSFFEKAKLSKGIIEGSCGIIQKGMRGSRLYLVEGFETGASIALADSKATVLCSFGVSNMKNLKETINKFNPKELVIAADNDGVFAKSQQAIEKTIDIYKQDNFKVTAIYPDSLEGLKKTDWNDVHRRKGIAEIQKQLMHKDIGDTSLLNVKPMAIPKPIINVVQMKSMRLNDAQITAIQNNSFRINNRSIENMIADFKVNQQPHFGGQSSIKSLTITVKREVDIEL